ncbi:hypothetical protein MIND_00187400 [Mycena indigotica]|uniref:Uncharacterized protein n=1 Tax=Mycena indigotica TaxID=2126181 RepID=A0A8H6WGS4_9AGAR|nr:uncharacterized protein MIND_00187400 [Mycena indigotica]KAF7311769.1 hypothetical protein MIND_00187400 [Mycena indigotica]
MVPRRTPRLSLADLPDELIHSILDQLLAEVYPFAPHSGLEDCRRECGLSLASTSRTLRACCLPWLFKRAYNWRRQGRGVWPTGLWCYFVELHLRSYSIRNPMLIPTSLEDLGFALCHMSKLTHLIISLESAITSEFLQRIATVSTLSILEFHGTPWHEITARASSFANISTLVVRIAGPHGAYRLAQEPGVAAEQVIIHEVLLAPLAPLLAESDYLCLDNPPDSTTLGELSEPALRFLGGLSSLTLSNLNPNQAGRILASLHSLRSLSLLTLRDGYTSQNERVSWFSPVHHPDIFCLVGPEAIQLLSQLPNLTKLHHLGITLYETGLTPDLQQFLNQNTPGLSSLQLRVKPRLGSGHLFIDFERTRLLQNLAHLRNLTVLTIILEYNLIEANPGPPAHSAFQIFREVPSLQTVIYKFAGCFDPSTLDPIVHTWHREMLKHPRPPRVIKEFRYPPTRRR